MSVYKQKKYTHERKNKRILLYTKSYTVKIMNINKLSTNICNSIQYTPPLVIIINKLF